MKKYYSFIAVAMFVVSLFALVSCEKEEYGKALFVATIENPTHQGKTDINVSAQNLGVMTWSNGDQIAVYGSTGSTEPCFLSTTSTTNTATFNSVVNGVSVPTTGDYYVIYPASMTQTSNGYNTCGTITLPATQTYHTAVGNKVQFEAPMCAYTQRSGNDQSENVNLQFKNLCGVVQLNLSGLSTSKTISKIMVGSNENICGNFTVTSWSGNNAPTMTHITVTGQNDKVMELDCGTGVSCGSGTTSFYIYLPAQTYTGLQFTFFATDGTHCSVSLKDNQSFIVGRNNLYPITLNNPPFDHPSAGRGVFTVKVDANQNPIKKVYFSPGNLQYKASTHTWRFAEHSYDFVGGDYDRGDGVVLHVGNVYENNVKSSNNLIDDDYAGWIDLFGWGTGDNPTLADANNNNHQYSNFVDWGTANISNSGNVTWYTLDKDEWDCLLNIREGHDSRVGSGQVIIGPRNPEDRIHGLIILPDEWNMPTGVTAPSWWADNTSENIFTPIEWALMEANGAVFLPVGGRRSGNTYAMASTGSYWTKSFTGSTQYYFTAYILSIDGSGLTYNLQDQPPQSGHSVRLVRTVVDNSNNTGGGKSNRVYFGQ